MNNLILLDPTIIERDTPVPPVIWNIENGIIYQDLKADLYEAAIDFLKENYFPYDTLFRAIDIVNDAEAMEAMCSIVRFLMKDECSMIAIDEATEEIVGVAIMKIMWEHDRSWYTISHY